VAIALTLLVPWYEADYSRNGFPSYQVEYGLGGFSREVSETKTTYEYSAGVERVGDLMSKLTVVLVLSLVASIVAVLLSYLNRRISGVIAGSISAGLLLLAGGMFYFEITDALNLDSFVGWTLLNRTWSVEYGPMLGWWLAITVPVVQASQAVVLAYSGRDD
jgi:hypothetical protein